MTEYYVDIRCKVEADSIEEAIYIVEQRTRVSNSLEHFIKAVGVSLSDINRMIGDVE